MVSQHALQVSRSTPNGKVEGSGLGVSRPTPKGKVEGSGLGGVSRPTPGGKLRDLAWGSGLGGRSPGRHPRGKLRDLAWGVSRPATPLPSRWLQLRAVCILLECILVPFKIGFNADLWCCLHIMSNGQRCRAENGDVNGIYVIEFLLVNTGSY